MNHGLAVVFWLAAAIIACAAPLRTERLWPLGKDFYNAHEWARSSGLRATWLTKKELELSNGSNKLVFTTDSRRMLLNGIIVWLSHEVVARNGKAYISVLDVNSAIGPVLSPPRNAPKEQVKHICIDPGHGGRDPGNREGGHEEKRYTLLLAQELGVQLRAAGFTVSFTRTTDAPVELDSRPLIANRRDADVLISLHFNDSGAGGRSVRGAETYCLTPQRASSTNARGVGGDTGAVTGNASNVKNMLLAFEIQKALVRNNGSEDRGVKRARYAVLRTARMPAVLVEAGFMTNPAEAANIYSAAWRKKTAQAIVTALRNYRSLLAR
jgi:N-acetylmuramoyl-L-alanine amidase